MLGRQPRGPARRRHLLSPIDPLVVTLPGGFTASKVTTSEESSCALSTAGAVLCWGKNDWGQLGDDTSAANSPSPVQPVGLDSGVAAIAAGATHLCAAMSTGGVRCWGSNLYGEQGIGSSGNGVRIPGEVANLSGFVAVDVGAGQYHSCAVSSSGAARCWGKNGDGQLGNGASGFNVDELQPVAVSGVANGASAITGGYGATCAIINSGVQCWGSNLNLVLGNGGTSSDLSAVPVAVTGLVAGATAIAATSTDHACAVVSGAVWCWGSAGAFLGTGDVTTNAPSPVRVLSLP